MHSLSLRRGVPGDEAALSLVGQATFLESFAGVLHGADIVAHCQRQHSIEKYAEWLGDGSSALWLLEAAPGAAPVGYLVLTRPDLPLADLGPGDLEVKRIYLLQGFRGGGHGKALMDTARTHAERKGHRRLLLGVYAKNTSAIGFYQALGYRAVGTRTFQVGHQRYHDLILGLELTT